MQENFPILGYNISLTSNNRLFRMDFYIYGFGYLYFMAEAIRTTVVPIRIFIRTTVVPITPLIGTTVVRIRILIGTTGI